jgi:hypothetical protein
MAPQTAKDVPRIQRVLSAGDDYCIDIEGYPDIVKLALIEQMRDGDRPASGGIRLMRESQSTGEMADIAGA